MNFVVLCSSNGTTFQEVLDRIADGSLTAKCIGLITDSETRRCVEKAKRAGVPFRVVEKNKTESQEEYDKKIFDAIQSFEAQHLSCHPEEHHFCDGSRRFAPHHDTKMARLEGRKMLNNHSNVIIACMGWMHIFSPWFIQKFPNHILNVHPALLPKYGGKGMYGINVHKEVLRHNEKESGMTIHIVTNEVDQGPILLQKKCPVLPTDSPEILQKRVQELEKEWYPKVLQDIEQGTIRLPT